MTPLDKEGQIRGEEPVVNLQPVFFDPPGQFSGAHSLVSLRCGRIHKQAVTRGRAEGVDDINLTLRIAFAENGSRIAGRIDGTGDPGRQTHMDDVLAVLKKRREEIDIFRDVYLGGTGVGALGHPVIKLVKGNGLPEIVRILNSVQGIVEADIMDVPGLKMFFAQVGSRAAAENITHGSRFLSVSKISFASAYHRKAGKTLYS